MTLPESRSSSDTSRPPRRHRRWPWIVLAVFVALVLGVVFFPWDVLIPTIDRKVTEATGRHFELAHIGVKYTWPPRIVLKGVRFDNPSWARDRQMLVANEISRSEERRVGKECRS